MGFGFSKDFVVFVFIAIIISLVFQNWKAGASVFLLYSVVKVIWKIMT